MDVVYVYKISMIELVNTYFGDLIPSCYFIYPLGAFAILKFISIKTPMREVGKRKGGERERKKEGKEREKDQRADLSNHDIYIERERESRMFTR